MMSTKFYAALFVVAVTTIGSASAFTYDNRTSQGTNLANLSGSGSDKDGKGTKIGNSRFSLTFSGSSSQPGYNSANSRFLPSANSSFSAPSYQGLTSMDSALGNRH